MTDELAERIVYDVRNRMVNGPTLTLSEAKKMTEIKSIHGEVYALQRDNITFLANVIRSYGVILVNTKTIIW